MSPTNQTMAFHFGGKGKWSMKNKTKYTKAPKGIAQAISASEPIEDFLPGPDKLVFKDESVKVTT